MSDNIQAISNITNNNDTYSNTLLTKEQVLIQELKSIKAGKDDWEGYEKVTHKILSHLFTKKENEQEEDKLNKEYEIENIDQTDSHYLSGYISEDGKFLEQSATENYFNIRDIIMPNYATKGFWKYIRERYDGDLIVVDCKNYTKPIKKNQITSVANYLTRKGCGLFAIICTRDEIHASATNALKNQWIHDDKMIVCLTDQDLIQMLNDKERGADPTIRIQTRIFDFRRELDSPSK